MVIIRKSSRRSLLIALIVVLPLAGAVYGWRSWHGGAMAGDALAGRGPLQTMNPRMAVSAAASVSVPANNADGRPVFIPADDWAAIQKGLRDHPHREAELRRIVAYLGFRSHLEQWKAMEGQSDMAERARLSETVLAALPERLLHQEVTGGEALLLQAELIKPLVHDQASFDARMQLEKERLRQVLASDAEMQAKLSREEAQATQYQQLADKVAERYQAKQISEQQLEQELDAARIKAFR